MKKALLALGVVLARIGQNDLARIHGTNERIAVESYGEAVRFYAQLLRNGAGAGRRHSPSRVPAIPSLPADNW